ncbi:ABC transporter ATP-binding protein [Lachnospiraceae bacterium WCA-693-APC-MOT-I]|uniref:ABC transporter ATP-binding protein n=2 Tax=Velocimicrobium porci TaxID=2606634 RepID=A0A6L5Y049_9FIRM|nr:ABC transporter ATP-binding protein [Velocimicrobium porci]
MQSDNVIEVKDLKKKFKVYYDKGNSLKEKILFKSRNKYEERWVLNGISFNVKKGEAIGLIGHNGCGKSTTLKLLNRIIYPTSGEIKMKGRVSSLIELGAGFHPDMSGRENIYINASIFGLTKKEIDERIDDIIEFSELEEFMDNPVRTYSSGMYMRLAFAVAINVDADILLIDEILAVGDANFQAKCFNKLREIKGKGVTIVIVSHSLGQVEQICDRTIWIDKGLIREEGQPRKVHPLYMDYMSDTTLNSHQKKEEEEEKTTESEEVQNENVVEENSPRDIGNFDIKITDVQLIDVKTRKPATKFHIEDQMELQVCYMRKNKNIKKCEFGFHIFRSDGLDYYGTNTLIDKVNSVELKDTGKISVVFGAIYLLQGEYKIDIAFHNDLGLTYNHRYNAVEFEIKNYYDEVGIARVTHEWIFNEKEK